MEFKSDYEFCPAQGCWEEGGEWYDGDKVVRSLSLFEDETGDITWYDDDGNSRYDYTAEIDGISYGDIVFGPASGVMWGKQQKTVFVRRPIPQMVNGFDTRIDPIGFVEYDASGESDNSEAYWKLADLIEKFYQA